MIILDTNQLRQAAPPHGAVLGMLQKLADISGHELALPQMVLDEYNAHHEHVVQAEIKNLQRAARKLSELFSRDIARQIPGLDVAQALQVMQASVDKVFTVLPTPTGAEHEALMREARRRRPAKTDWTSPGSGARDVVIWLTVLHTASRQHGDVLFLSQDKGFGTNAGFHAELQEEVMPGGTATLRLLNGGIGQLLGEVATKAPTPPNIMALLGHETVTKGVASFLLENVREFFYSLPDDMRPFRGGRSLPDWTAPTMIPAEEPTQSQAYKVDGTTWLSVRVRWHGSQRFSLFTGQVFQSTAGARAWTDEHFAVGTTLLIELDSNEEPVSVEVTRSGPIELARGS